MWFLFFMFGELPLAETLLEQIIQAHDPNGRWESFQFNLKIRETRPNADDRQIEVDLHSSGTWFRYVMKGSPEVIKTLENGVCSARLDGKEDYSKEAEAEFRLSCEAIQRYRNYYLYLYGLPMKLKDPGTVLNPDVKKMTFQDREVLALRVTYNAKVGKDTWDFFVDPRSKLLVGCRFFHEGSKNDGEYIVFKEYYEMEGLVLPANRYWYTNRDNTFLGSDHLFGHEPSTKKK